MHEQPVALVTGASRGIGRAIALELGTLDHAVLVNYVSNESAAQEVVSAITERGGRGVAVQGDVGHAPDRVKLVRTAIETFGRIDVLVNNAGITSPGRRDLLEVNEEGWELVFATNLKGPFFLSQLVAREMIALVRAGQTPGGTIINVSSISGYAVSTNRGDYCLTKSALHTMTQLFAVRLADERIGVYEICPGVIDSDMTAPVREKYDRLIAEGLSPQRRWGEPADVAKAVAAIVSGYLPFSTGQQIHVDGGFHIRRL
ncbi:MAG: 3-ketoacyl-ACP reductase [Pirellulales bacterium]|nr:3-ketoacyl-ACP reductase [Pirellulales bacterium]